MADKLPDQFAVHIKNLVSRKIVKELLMKDRYASATSSSQERVVFYLVILMSNRQGKLHQFAFSTVRFTDDKSLSRPIFM